MDPSAHRKKKKVQNHTKRAKQEEIERARGERLNVNKYIIKEVLKCKGYITINHENHNDVKLYTRSTIKKKKQLITTTTKSTEAAKKFSLKLTNSTKGVALKKKAGTGHLTFIDTRH